MKCWVHGVLKTSREDPIRSLNLLDGTKNAPYYYRDGQSSPKTSEQKKRFKGSSEVAQKSS